jgi:hypothetical protein
MLHKTILHRNDRRRSVLQTSLLVSIVFRQHHLFYPLVQIRVEPMPRPRRLFSPMAMS